MVTKQQTSCNDNIYIFFLQFIKKTKHKCSYVSGDVLAFLYSITLPKASITAKGQTCHYVKNVNFPSEMANYCMKQRL